MTDPRTLAEAYHLAANWHDKNAAGCSAIADDEPRVSADARERARIAATHHRASAAGLRLAASAMIRKTLS
ncbi:UNVERIFIED_ORG: hypothetical protein GGD59_002269 [Rhizobium esperanzae]